MTTNSVLYLRVSTAQQAEKDLSIPDQENRCRDYSVANGMDVAKIYIEPGVSGTTDNRPALQEMITDLSSGKIEAKAVIIHSFSRFFRDSMMLEWYRRKLEKMGVELISITQPVMDDAAGHMARQMMSIFDEYQSKEISKHVSRSMIENAKQGFWNGSAPPLGYSTEITEIRGRSEKKKLIVNEQEANIIRLIFELYTNGVAHGVYGFPSVAAHINERGYRKRSGTTFTANNIEKFIKSTTYKGMHYYNKYCSKTKKKKEMSEWVPNVVPAVISEELWDYAQETRESRQTANTPARVVNGPTLLVGVAKCGSCGSAMIQTTGKGGKYRYYSCSGNKKKGKSVCQGNNIPLEKLDEAVIERLQERLLERDRLEQILKAILQKQVLRKDTSLEEEKALRKSLRETDAKIDRLFDAIAEGMIDHNESFKRNLSKHEAMKDNLLRQISKLSRAKGAKPKEITDTKISQFADVMKEGLSNIGSKLRKPYLQQIVGEVRVGKEKITITGSKAVLASIIAATDLVGVDGVPIYPPKWWSLGGSNS